MKHFDMFGVMIDCSRNSVPDVPALKRFFEILSKMGYNMAMLYTEDTYEIPEEPFFGYKRGRYSQSELRELDAYAASLGIELIPCIQTLAHVNALMRWEKYRNIRDTGDILLAGDERTYELVDKMFKSLAASFTTRKLHIGMDEAHMVGLGQYLDIHGFENRHDILLRHLDRVREIAKKYGFEIMMWEDMFFRLSFNGTFFVVNHDKPNDRHISPEVIKKIPRDVGMVYWDYYSDHKDIYDGMIDLSRELSDKVIFAGGAWRWGTLCPHNRLSMRRNELAIASCIEKGVRDAFFCIWGDDGAETPMFDVLPALMHAAAVAEQMDEDTMKAKFREIVGVDYDDMLTLDLPNYIYGPDVSVGMANYSKNRLYNDPFLDIVGKNADEPVDTEIFRKYRDGFAECAAKYEEFGYLFETQRALCDILIEKFDLGERTRLCYQSGDRDGLRALALGDYTVFEEKWQHFYDAYCEQWDKVNKPYSFEVHDARLGGLLIRMKHCKKRLLDYCDGKTADIPELADEVLSHDGGNTNYKETVTASIL